jgi:hypothetical protein
LIYNPGGSLITVSDNAVSNAQRPIHVQGAADALVKKNSLGLFAHATVGGTGILGYGNTKLQVIRNEITGQAGTAYYSYGTWIDTYTGSGPGSAEIKKNTFNNTDIGLILGEDVHPLTVVVGGASGDANDFSGSSSFIYLYYMASDVDATYNYWGTCDPGAIEAGIWHYPDDNSLGTVDFSHCLGEPTAITLPSSSFTAQVGPGGVNVAWETGTEVDNAGFNLFRATLADGSYTQVNDTLIAAQGDPVSGASYSFLDAVGYGTYYYKLEAVDLYGVSTLHGPVRVTLARPLRRPLYRPSLPEF